MLASPTLVFAVSVVPTHTPIKLPVMPLLAPTTNQKTVMHHLRQPQLATTLLLHLLQPSLRLQSPQLLMGEKKPNRWPKHLLQLRLPLATTTNNAHAVLVWLDHQVHLVLMVKMVRTVKPVLTEMPVPMLQKALANNLQSHASSVMMLLQDQLVLQGQRVQTVNQVKTVATDNLVLQAPQDLSVQLVQQVHLVQPVLQAQPVKLVNSKMFLVLLAHLGLQVHLAQPVQLVLLELQAAASQDHKVHLVTMVRMVLLVHQVLQERLVHKVMLVPEVNAHTVHHHVQLQDIKPSSL